MAVPLISSFVCLFEFLSLMYGAEHMENAELVISRSVGGARPISRGTRVISFILCSKLDFGAQNAERATERV